MNENCLNEYPWQYEHRDDGISFLAYPEAHDGKIKYIWIGPFDKKTANFIFDAIVEKQKTSKVARDFLYDPPA